MNSPEVEDRALFFSPRLRFQDKINAKNSIFKFTNTDLKQGR